MCQEGIHFTSLLLASGWSGQHECCVWMCTYIWIRSVVIIENWIANHVFGVRTSFETKSTVQMQRCFWHEFDVGAITILHSCVRNTTESRFLEVNRTKIALNYQEAWNKQVTKFSLAFSIHCSCAL